MIVNFTSQSWYNWRRDWYSLERSIRKSMSRSMQSGSESGSKLQKEWQTRPQANDYYILWIQEQYIQELISHSYTRDTHYQQKALMAIAVIKLQFKCSNETSQNRYYQKQLPFSLRVNVEFGQTTNLSKHGVATDNEISDKYIFLVFFKNPPQCI